MKILLASLYLFFLAKTTLMGVEVPIVEARLPRQTPVPEIVIAQIVVEAEEVVTSNCDLPSEVLDPAIAIDWHLVYRWCELITVKAVEYGFDPTLIAAIVFIESTGDPNSYSPAGAVGLMQVMPRDGLAADDMCENGLCFSDRPTTIELLVPEFNVQIGLEILWGNLVYYKEMREALKHYGPPDYGYRYVDLVLATCQKINVEANCSA